MLYIVLQIAQQIEKYKIKHLFHSIPLDERKTQLPESRRKRASSAATLAARTVLAHDGMRAAKVMRLIVKQNIGVARKEVALAPRRDLVAAREVKASQRLDAQVEHAIVRHAVAPVEAQILQRKVAAERLEAAVGDRTNVGAVEVAQRVPVGRVMRGRGGDQRLERRIVDRRA